MVEIYKKNGIYACLGVKSWVYYAPKKCIFLISFHQKLYLLKMSYHLNPKRCTLGIISHIPFSILYTIYDFQPKSHKHMGVKTWQTSRHADEFFWGWPTPQDPWPSKEICSSSKFQFFHSQLCLIGPIACGSGKLSNIFVRRLSNRPWLRYGLCSGLVLTPCDHYSGPRQGRLVYIAAFALPSASLSIPDSTQTHPRRFVIAPISFPDEPLRTVNNPVVLEKSLTH